MSPQHRKFVNAYLGEANGNGTKAAIAAGYSEPTAAQQASRLLKRDDIRQAIGQRLDKHDLRTDAILQRLGILAHSTVEKVTGADVVNASKVILQVNGALRDKDTSARITVNIGFLTPSQPAIEVIDAGNSSTRALPAVMPSEMPTLAQVSDSRED